MHALPVIPGGAKYVVVSRPASSYLVATPTMAHVYSARPAMRSMLVLIALSLPVRLLGQPLVVEEVDASSHPRLTVRIASAAALTVPTGAALSVTEDGKLAADAKATLEARPVALVIAIEASAATAPVLGDENLLAWKVAEKLPAGSLVALMPFSSEAPTPPVLTPDTGSVRTVGAGVRAAGGAALLDSLKIAVDAAGAYAKTHRGVVIALGSMKDQDATGKKRGSTSTAKEVAVLARGLGVPVHLVAIGAGAATAVAAKLAPALRGTSLALPEHADDATFGRARDALVNLTSGAVNVSWTVVSPADGVRHTAQVKLGADAVAVTYDAPGQPPQAVAGRRPTSAAPPAGQDRRAFPKPDPTGLTFTPPAGWDTTPPGNAAADEFQRRLKEARRAHQSRSTDDSR